MSSRENSVTGLVAQYLRENGISANTFERLEIPGRGIKEPDFAVRNGGNYYGEAKWEDKYNKGIVEATEYQQAPKANGTFVIAYPDEFKDEIQQRRLTDDAESILEGYDFSVTFLRKDGDTDMQTVSISELSEWLDRQIHAEIEPVTDAEEVVKILRQAANALTQEVSEVEAIDLFENVLGIETEEGNKAESARRVVGFLMVNQIVFYRVLSSATDFEPIDADSLSSPGELVEYFDKVLEKDYTPIFGISVADFYDQKHLPLIKEAIRSTYVINPERIHHEVLGDIFHELIPKPLRKRVAAYYTKNKAAHLLAGVSIDEKDSTVFDPACGTGTLLTSSYRIKRKKTSGFNKDDHRQFLEDDITGIDVMPFAAHLATIHLALQNPQYETENVRVGIEDSTKLQPGGEVSPLSKMLPEDEIQRTFDTFNKSIEDFEEQKIIERGGIARQGMEQKPLKLKEVDLVIMNPPYSRQEVMSDFSEDYKNKLKQNRLRKYKSHIDLRMNFYGYFFLIADRFITTGSRIAAVTSVGLLNIKTDKGIRELLMKKYDIEYIFIRGDESSFSEDTDRREVMTVAKKGGEKSATNFVRLNNLDISPYSIISEVDDLDSGESVKNDDYSIQRIDVDKLNANNLFSPFAVRQNELMMLWENITESNNLIEIEKLEPGRIGGARGGGYDARDYHPEMSINSPNVYDLKESDVWILDQDNTDSIVAQQRFTKDRFTIPKDCLELNVRGFSGRRTANLSKVNEYVILSRFDEFDKFESQTREEDIPVEEWEGRMKSRMGHIAIVRRGNITAKGTSHLAFYSEKRRLWPDTMWIFTDLTSTEAKILTAWIDSTFGWFQYLLDRIETEGGYSNWHGYIVDKFRIIDPRQLEKEHKNSLLNQVENYGNLEVGSIPEQLAALTPEDVLTDKEKSDIKNTFPDISFDEGLKERRELDEKILTILGVPEQEQSEILAKLYPKLLKEIEILKRMMES